ncbi:uncharacterized protein J8A68_005647 [[Candida] subhashii]|uniref:Inner nuclear membrane protein SRC1 n=1 Tax=[Candida] subhashii TaxID=561895 RepID=A0A8J5USN5_9ASCO|nr:uncharacterized protein J8A68_005647 [[Candida] subhashii]KAG7660830.1 hypothetical protein J8A68_005647 [[Candida] subhashii]
MSEHLQEGFDPKSLKVAQLRNILNLHNIEYPSNAKKQQLVDLFHENITPKSGELLRDYNERANKISGEGIVNMGGSGSVMKENEIISIDDEDEDYEEEKESKSQPLKKVRKSSRSTTPNVESKPASRKGSRKVSRTSRKSSKLSENQESEADKLEESPKQDKSKTKKLHQSEININSSPFSSENVFQASSDSGKKRKFIDIDSIFEKDNTKKRSRSPVKSIFDDSSDGSDIEVLPFMGDFTKINESKKKESSSRATPVKSGSSSKKTPVKTVSDKDIPTKAASAKNTPAKSAPVESSSAKAASAKSTPVKVTPAKVTPAKTTPAKATPATSTPVKDTPVKLTPVKATPAKATPAKNTPVSKSTKETTTPAKEIITPKIPKSAHKEESSSTDKRTSSSSSKKTPSKITKPASKKSTPKSTSISKSSPLSKPTSVKKSTHKTHKARQSSIDESFKSSEEERKHFDEGLHKIKHREEEEEEQQHSQTPSIPRVNADLIKDRLGITIEGFIPPSNIPPSMVDLRTPIKKNNELGKIESPRLLRIPSDSEISSNVSSMSGNNNSVVNQKLNELKMASMLSPKPRLIPIPSILEGEDDDEEEEEDTLEEEGEISIVPKKNTTGDEVEDTKQGEAVEEIIQEEQVVNNKLPTKSTVFGILFTFFIWILVVSVGFLGYWYHEQQYLVGYCGQEIYERTFPDTDSYIIASLGEYLDSHCRPRCIPCPPHARCFPRLELGCYEDFIEYKPWNGFLFPGNKKCVPDSKKAEKLEIMIDVALDLLRSKNSQINCGKGESIEESGIGVDELHDLLLSMKAPYITLEEFEELWARSVIELEKEPDIIVRQTGYSSLSNQEFVINPNDPDFGLEAAKEYKTILRSTSLSNISLKCQIKNSLIGGIVQFKYHISIIFLAFILIKLIQYKYNQYQLYLIKIDILYREVIKKLVNQLKLSQSNNTIQPYIGSNQLRDLILEHENNLSVRIQIWDDVSSKVENNTNVSSQVLEHHGEIMKVWQWIGGDVEL